MQIDTRSTTGAVGRVDANHPATEKRKVALDHATFEQAEALNDDYRREPDVRADVVSKAKELVSETQWPPPETIRKIASLLAMEIPKDQN